jgi:hypothetical protein
MDKIKEAQKIDKEIGETKSKMHEGKAKDFAKMSKELYGLRSMFAYRKILNLES